MDKARKLLGKEDGGPGVSFRRPRQRGWRARKARIAQSFSIYMETFKKHAFDPTSKFNFFWNITMIIVNLNNVFGVPFRIAFQWHYRFVYLIICDLVCDLLMAFDIVVCMHRSFFDHGHLKTDLQEIKAVYRRTNMRVDVLSLLPLY